MRIGVDTNVLFYFLDKDSPFHAETRKALAGLVEKQSAVVTQQNLVELAATLTRRGVPPAAAGKYVHGFMETIRVLRPTTDTVKIFLSEMEGRSSKGARLFALYLAATLMSNGVELFYTYNEKDFSGISGLKVWRPGARFWDSGEKRGSGWR